MSAFVVLFLGLFCVVGIGVAVSLSGRPMYRAMQSRAWPASTCEIVSSNLEPGGDSVRAPLQFRYEVAGRTYLSTQYNFVSGNGGTNAATQRAIAGAYPAGRRVPCYVNPADPTDAVLVRDITGAYYFGLIFGGMFTIVPGSMIVVYLTTVRKKMVSAQPKDSAAQSVARGFDDTTRSIESGPYVLKQQTTRLGKLIGITLICLFWNGLVGVFTYFEVTEFVKDGGQWFIVLFLVPFQLIGLALLAAVPYQLLALANPRPIITLNHSSVPVGGSISLEWQLQGAANRVKKLVMTLEAREEARYRRGTTSYTDTNVFYRAPLVDATDASSIARGSAALRIPADSMHSFRADNNKIIWTIKMKGDIDRWPDVDDSFDIEVTAR